MCLQNIIINEIDRKGPISFKDFMEMCLYYPGEGYYTSPENRIGKEGDYYTSPCLGPLFGSVVARQVAEMWEQMRKRPFDVVEFGAGTGLLCHHILDALQHNNDALYKNLTYHLVEKNQQLEPDNIHTGKIKIHESFSELEEFEGCVLSNELLDNFSIHQVIMNNEMMEVMVRYENGEFKEETKPASIEIKDYFKELEVDLPDGFRTEANLGATEWLKSISQKLKKGFVLTIDYGFPSNELYHEKRRAGNIVCYYKHHVNFCPYHHIGEQDITAHINFSALKHWGLKYGLQPAGYTTQGHFLSALGIGNLLRQYEHFKNSSKLLKALLIDLGSKMKVFIQQKNMSSPKLTGLMFSEKLL